MAKTILDKVSLELSYKLQDPVTAGTVDGARLTAAERLSYIMRGYRRLLRLVSLIYPELTSSLFKKYFSRIQLNTNNSGVVLGTILDKAEVFSIYGKQPNDEYYKKIEQIPLDKSIEIERGENAFYTPDLDSNRLFMYINEDDIYILPAVEYNLDILYRPDIASIVEAEGYDGVTDLDIPLEFIDILLTSAAMEAYMDLTETQVVQMYKSDLIDQLSILAKKQEQKELKDEV